MVIPGGLRGQAAWGQVAAAPAFAPAVPYRSDRYQVTAPPALSGDDWDVGKKAVDQPNQQVRVMLPDFDQWVLGGKTRDQMERTLRSLLALHVESVARACELSGAQREKLQLAGEGDLKRLFRTIEKLREKHRDVGQDQQKVNAFVQEMSPLQMKLQTGVYDDSSLFRKVLRQTLNHEQSAQYEQQERERRKFRYEAKIELVLSTLQNNISLRADQRQRLVKLLLDETEPPKKFGVGQYDYYIVLCQAGRLPEAKLKPIFDDAQWRSFQRLLTRYRGMETFLQQQGFLPPQGGGGGFF